MHLYLIRRPCFKKPESDEFSRLFISDATDTFLIPHSLALINGETEICVADRQHGRIQCFSSEDGTFTRSMTPDQGGSTARTVYGIDYSDGKALDSANTHISMQDALSCLE